MSAILKCVVFRNKVPPLTDNEQLLLSKLGEHHQTLGTGGKEVHVSALRGPLSMMHGNSRKPSSTLGSHLRGLLHFASNVLQVRLFGLLSCLLDCVFSHWPHAPSSGLLYYAYFTEV